MIITRARLELLDAATTAAWEQAGRQGMQHELAPSFQRAGAQLEVLRQMTYDFRDPVIWVLMAIVAGVAEIIAFVLLDQDLIKHDQAEAGIEYELSVIYSGLGRRLPAPQQGRVKRPDNYVGRIVAAISPSASTCSGGSTTRCRNPTSTSPSTGPGGPACESSDGVRLRPAARSPGAAIRSGTARHHAHPKSSRALRADRHKYLCGAP